MFLNTVTKENATRNLLVVLFILFLDIFLGVERAHASDLEFSPSSLSFGKVQVGDSKTMSVTLTNKRSFVVVNGVEINQSSHPDQDYAGTVSFGGGTGDPFTCVSGCTFDLSPNESQTITFSFAPTWNTTYSKNASAIGRVVSLSGEGMVAPQCGTSAHNYYSFDSDYQYSFNVNGVSGYTSGARNYCTPVYGVGPSPAFPPVGGSASWSCANYNGTAGPSCTVTRNNFPTGSLSVPGCTIPRGSGGCNVTASASAQGQEGYLQVMSSGGGRNVSSGQATNVPVYYGSNSYSLYDFVSSSYDTFSGAVGHIVRSSSGSGSAVAYATGVCEAGVPWNGTTCDFPSCTGNLPSNASMYDAEESSSLSTDTARRYSATDTTAKCEYKCNSGYVWDSSSSSCVAPVPPAAGTPSASIDAPDCTIVAGQGSCSTSITWSTANITTPSVREDGAQFSSAISSDGMSRTITQGTHTFTIYDGTTEYASDSGTASCATDSVWNSTSNTCEGIPPPAPVLTLGASPTSITAGSNSTLTWNITGTADSCWASGGWAGWQSYAIGNNTTSVSPSATTTYSLECFNAGVSSGVKNAAIGVRPAAPPNVPPTVSAGSDRTITLPTSSASPSGASASDPDGILSLFARKWTFVSGPGPTPAIFMDRSLIPTFSNMSANGQYVFRLTVTDSEGASSADTMIVHVLSAAACDDDIDNDGDGAVDHNGTKLNPTNIDPGCSSLTDDSEVNGTPTLTASPVMVRNGSETTLTWNLNGGTGCTLVGGGKNFNLSSGTSSSTPVDGRIVYTLTCPSFSPVTAMVNVIPDISE